MEEFRLNDLMFVALLAFAVPFVLGFFPRVRVASAVVELIAGMLVGPAVLGWVSIDVPVQIMSSIGVAFLLFLAGMELDLRVLKGPALRLGAIGFVVSLTLAIAIEMTFKELGQVNTPFLIAIALSATSVGIVVPVLRDAGYLRTPTGIFTLAGGSAAEFGTIVLLGLFFASDGYGPGVEGIFLVVLAVLAALLFRGLVWFSGREATQRVFRRLDDTSSQVRVRLAVLILLAAAVFASAFGFEAILGTFLAGAIFAVVIRGWDDLETFRKKLDGVGFGFFVPVFFIVSGMRLDLGALWGWYEAARVLVLFLVLLVVRAVPVLLYRRYLSGRELAASGLLQATNLSFVVVAVTVGENLGKVTMSGGTGLIAAGLLSAIIFPPIAHRLLKGGAPEAEQTSPAPPAAAPGSALPAPSQPAP